MVSVNKTQELACSSDWWSSKAATLKSYQRAPFEYLLRFHAGAYLDDGKCSKTDVSVFLSVSENPIILLLMANLFLAVVGMFMDDASGILLASPLLMPLMLQVGVDPVQFAAIVAVNLGMGRVTPPTAPILYFAALIGKAQVGYMMKPALVFVLGAYLPVVLLVWRIFGTANRTGGRLGRFISGSGDQFEQRGISLLLLVDLRLNEPGQFGQRVLPTEIAGLARDQVRDARLLNVDLGTNRNLLEDDADQQLAR